MRAEVKIDPELGPVRYCRRCDDWWPLDAEFWYREMSERRDAWHCRACKADRTRPGICVTCLTVRTTRVECHGCSGRMAGPLTVEMLTRLGLGARREVAA